MANTPLRAIRIPDGVWYRAMATAQTRGETVSDIVRAALEEYGTKKSLHAPKRVKSEK